MSFPSASLTTNAKAGDGIQAYPAAGVYVGLAENEKDSDRERIKITVRRTNEA